MLLTILLVLLSIYIIPIPWIALVVGVVNWREAKRCDWTTKDWDTIYNSLVVGFLWPVLVYMLLCCILFGNNAKQKCS